MKIPLAYRPDKEDDWGVIRSADGSQCLDVRDAVFHDWVTIARHRSQGTDPVEGIGREVVHKLNSFDAIQAQRDELLAACKRWMRAMNRLCESGGKVVVGPEESEAIYEQVKAAIANATDDGK